MVQIPKTTWIEIQTLIDQLAKQQAELKNELSELKQKHTDEQLAWTAALKARDDLLLTEKQHSKSLEISLSQSTKKSETLRLIVDIESVALVVSLIVGGIAWLR